MLLEKEGHDYSHHDGIDEENGGGNAGIEVVETGVEGERRYGKEDTQCSEGFQLLARQPERLMLHPHDAGENNHRKQKPIEKYRTGVQTLAVEVEGSQRIGAVAYCRNDTEYRAFDFCTHLLSLFRGAKIHTTLVSKDRFPAVFFRRCHQKAFFSPLKALTTVRKIILMSSQKFQCSIYHTSYSTRRSICHSSRVSPR